VKTVSKAFAGELEAQHQKQYFVQYWELPPLNGRFEDPENLDQWETALNGSRLRQPSGGR
jgi:hypothetical protein